jgi:hypothetical protein
VCGQVITKLTDEYLLVLPEIQSISVFDSIIYHSFDLEVLCHAQRMYLIEKARTQGFTQTSGKVLTHPDTTRIYFPPHRLFNRNFRSFVPKDRDQMTWLALTPTQSAFLLFEKQASEEDLYQLMMRHPFNLPLLFRVCSHEEFYPRLQRMGAELKRLAERAEVMLKSKKPLT